MKVQTVRKPDIRVKKTFDKLFNSFFDLIKVTPYDDITVIDICHLAGVHRATFYKHFIDKQDFVNFCFNEKLEKLQIDCNDELIFSAHINDADENFETVKKIIDFVYENRHIIADLNLSSSSNTFSQALINAISDMFEKKIKRMADMDIAIVSPIPMLAHYYAGAIVEALKWWSLEGTEYGKEEILKFVMRRFGEIQYTTKTSKTSSKT